MTYRLEFRPTNPPRPVAIWQMQEGKAERCVAILERGAGCGMAEAEAMLAALRGVGDHDQTAGQSEHNTQTNDQSPESCVFVKSTQSPLLQTDLQAVYEASRKARRQLTLATYDHLNHKG